MRDEIRTLVYLTMAAAVWLLLVDVGGIARSPLDSVVICSIGVGLAVLLLRCISRGE